MKTFTTYAEKKAKQFLNLLQGYTKGIRITAILILLLMGVSNAWGVGYNGESHVYLKVNGTTKYYKVSTESWSTGASLPGTWGGVLKDQTFSNIYELQIVGGAVGGWTNPGESISGTLYYKITTTTTTPSSGWTNFGSIASKSTYSNSNCFYYKDNGSTDVTPRTSGTHYLHIKITDGGGNNRTSYVKITVPSYTVAGSSAILGTDWDVTDTNNDMVWSTGTKYTLTKSNVTLNKNTTYKCKVALNHAWTTAYPNQDKEFTVNEDGNYNVTFTFDASSKTVEVSTTRLYAVIYNGNNQTSGSVPATSYYPSGSTITVASNSGNLSKTGYDFAGWNEKSDGKGTNYTAGSGTFTMPSSNTTLYAQWTLVNYTITYNTNGGSGTMAPTSYTIETTTFNLPTPTKTGYTFAGWYTKNDFSDAKVTQIVKGTTGNKTFYAKWTANTNTAYTVKHYKQQLDGNYSATPDETENLTGTTDASVTPAVKSYTGFTAPSAQTVTIKADGSLVVTYKYTRNKHTLTWNLDGGDITGAGTAAGEVAYGATLTAPTVEKDGHTFTGWSPAVPATMPDNDVTYTAQWTKNKYTVAYGVVGAANGTIALNNETPAIKDQNKQDFEHGTKLTFTATPADGYRVLEPQGWFSDEEGNTSLGNGTAKTYTINSLTDAASVFVAFEKIPASTYIVTFDANGGSGTMNSQSFTENEPQNLTTNAFTRTGYTFAGWNTAANGTGTSYTDGQSVTLTTAGLTLYAQWTTNTYTVTLDQEGATTPGTRSMTVTYDAEMPTITCPTKNGYAFMGYWDAKEGAGNQYYKADGTSERTWDKIDNTTLYAYFKKAEITSITLNKDVFESGETGFVIVTSHEIAPTPAGTVVVCWTLCYNNGTPVEGHNAIKEDGTVKFSLEGLSSGTYKIVASLRLNDCNGEELDRAEATFVVAGSYTVTIKYTCDGQEIAGRTTIEGHPSRETAVTAATIGGYNFVKWELGDGISTTDALTDQTINITASYKGYLTATYEKKKLIFLDLSTLKTKVNWTTPHIYLYKGAKNENTGGYWNDQTGAGGATGGNYITHAAMTKVPDTENIWYFDYEQYTNNFNVFVAFTSNNQGNVTHFADCEVIYRADFTSGTPVFVPASDQTAETKNSTAKYYSKGYWVRYMGGTGYWMIIYDAEGNKELVRREFTSETQRMTMTSIVDLEAKHTYKYEIYRNDGYYYNGGDITYTNSSNYKPLNEANKHSIKTTESGNYTFTLDYSAGDLQIKVQYPVEVGDYRILYKDNTRTTYKPSDIKKAEELNPVTSFFIRPKSNPELKIQTATYISDSDVSWSTTNEDEIHFKPNDLWTSDNARFAAYFYKGSTTKVWKDLTKNGDIYTCEKPSGCTHVIFCRMNPDVKTNSFDKGNGKPLWNQTRDLTLPTDKKNFYTLEEGAWRGQIYLKPNDNWTVDGARFAAYFFENSGGNEWRSMFKEDDGTYWCDIPEGYSQVIFCRMNPNVQDNNWNKGDGQPFWGMQTNDLQIPTNSNDLYTITKGQDKPSGAWSCKSWNEINTGSITDLTEELKEKLGEINGDIGKAPDSVYTIHLSNNEGTLTIEKVAFYTGNFYIRVDAAAGRWYDYKTNPDNLMTYSAFSESDANSFGEKFSHYKTKWCPRGTNVKFVIANDYSPCISDTLARDLVKASGDDYMTEGGELYQEDGGTKDPVYDRYSANIRFMWHRKTNVISRAYLASSSNDSRQFLVLKGCQEIKDENGNNLSGNGDNHGEHCALLQDTQDWIYERTFMVQPGTRVKLYACYADETVSPATAQYFRGKHDDGNCGSAENSVQILGGNGTEWEKIRVIYDFKTNRLMGAWVPSGEISETQTIAADVMIMRNHQEDATCITLAEGKSLDSVKTVYGALRFNRWTLNNKDANSHQPLPLAQQQTIYERGLYFISFPFDVHLSDVFGLGTYGTHWVISTYNGKRRAERGYFAEDCINEDCTNWDYIWDPTDFVMKANEGYLLSLDLELMKDDDNSFWPHNINYRELFFPSQVELETITKTNYTMPELGSEYKCTINLNTDGTQHERDRRVKDSYWRCIGVPSFADYSGLLKDGSDEYITWQPAGGNLPFLYDWNVTNNNLVVRSATNYRFRPTFAYLIQNGNEIHWSAVNTKKPTSIIARDQTENVSNFEWKIALLRNDAPADHTFIRMTDNESVTSAFDFHQDLSKEFNYGANIYTLVGYERLAANSLPMSDSTTIIPLGVSAQEAGDYTITMPEGVESIGITLVDNETGIHTNLSAGQEYTLTLNKGICENRLFIEVSPIQNTPTDLEYTTEDTREQTTRKMLIDGILYLIRDGVIYDAQGHRL